MTKSKCVRIRRLALVAAGALVPACAAPPPASPGKASGLPARSEAARALADELVEAHNRTRLAHGRPSLEVDPALQAAARQHALEMARRHRMTHRGADGSTAADRIRTEGYRYRRAGENVAQGQPTVDSVMNAWMKSPPHRRNVLGTFSQIGTACATDSTGTLYWCVTFGSLEGS